jgi:hypothetical protein
MMMVFLIKGLEHFSATILSTQFSNKKKSEKILANISKQKTQLFNWMDSSGDGQVSAEEFQALLAKSGQPAPPDLEDILITVRR